ncbi:CPBP family intramembrane metalloprotease [Arthrobacter sp. JZ12]|uniref:CPBP family intramembrane glutamic endopeptidase n=1 Tax=Arthrobacter sp. JZ12 TaxID=2654190 RepID=UPI002B45FC74|nr:CPBP family intramembrane glutamic endopeptidase [Arthrobacter sp. JZ12]WRH23692.1 CPBP family intramembrane metalloprotease [Arthrobacter sp. JZ12]
MSQSPSLNTVGNSRMRLANPAQLTPSGLVAPRWGVGLAFLGLLLVVLLPLLGTLALVEVIDFGPPLVFASLLLTWTAMLGVALYASRRQGFGSFVRDYGLRFRWIDLAVGLAVGIAARIVLAIVLAILTLLWPLEEGEVLSGNAELFLTGDTVWLIINGIMGGVLIAPFLEELFNRGVVLRGIQNAMWLRRTGSRKEKVSPAVQRRSITTATVFALLVSSLAFGLLHTGAVADLRSSVYLLLGTFTVGLMCGVLTVLTGRLGPAIITHVVFNGTGVALVLLIPPELLP